MENLLDRAAVDKLDALSSDVVSEAAVIEIRDAADLKPASAILAGIKELLTEVDDVFGPPTKAANAAHKSILAARRKVEGPILEAERSVKAAVSGFHDRLRAADEARKREAAEKQRLQEEEKRLAAAIELEAAGDADEAEAVLDAPIQVVAPPAVHTAPPRTRGLGTSLKRTAEITDIRRLVEFITGAPEFYYLLEIDQSALNKIARAAKDKPGGSELLPGVTLVIETQISSRSW